MKNSVPTVSSIRGAMESSKSVQHTVSSLSATPIGGDMFYESESMYNSVMEYNSYDLYRSVLEITLNISFLAATSNQLRLLVSFREAQNFIASTVLVLISLVTQILIAINVVTIAVHNQHRWTKLKAATSVGCILLTVINIVIPFIINVEHSRVDYSEIYPHHMH
ncbi:uncharacterized protein LOC128743324 [Sabethes cyaneus]|uniref:uncharacterized protein LOC128743324 n=1 Tax=Sabethes cyaneus TaxID=53552 RepID=UPI00237EC429|nr:uncharacterized protein LOC128743324 [Sabethes cyaneus]